MLQAVFSPAAMRSLSADGFLLNRTPLSCQPHPAPPRLPADTEQDLLQAYTAGELGATISLDSAPAAAAAVSTTSSGGAATGGRSKRARQADQPAQQQEELEEVAAATPAEVELLPPSAIAQQQPQLPRPSFRGHSRRRVTQAALRSLSTGQTAGQAPPCSGTPPMSLPAGAGQVEQAATAEAPVAPLCLNLAAPEGAAPAGSAALQRQPASPQHLAGEQHTGATYPASSHEAGLQPSPPPTPAFLRSTRPAAFASPWAMVGRRIGIWWADDGCFYTCTGVCVWLLPVPAPAGRLRPLLRSWPTSTSGQKHIWPICTCQG